MTRTKNAFSSCLRKVQMELELQYSKEGKIYSHIRRKYLVATPRGKSKTSFCVCLM